MRYVSIDIETLGLDPDTCDVIEFGAVIDDFQTPIEQLPRFHCYLEKDHYQGQPYAMAMHSAILKRIATREDGYRYIPGDLLGETFRNWLADNDYETNWVYPASCVEVVAAGKNFQAFDMRFLRRIPSFTNCVRIHHRVLDPATLFFNYLTDFTPPSLDSCLERAGFNKEVAHTAVEDAIDVIRLLRHKFAPHLFTAS